MSDDKHRTTELSSNRAIRWWSGCEECVYAVHGPLYCRYNAIFNVSHTQFPSEIRTIALIIQHNLIFIQIYEFTVFLCLLLLFSVFHICCIHQIDLPIFIPFARFIALCMGRVPWRIISFCVFLCVFAICKFRTQVQCFLRCKYINVECTFLTHRHLLYSVLASC